MKAIFACIVLSSCSAPQGAAPAPADANPSERAASAGTATSSAPEADALGCRTRRDCGESAPMCCAPADGTAEPSCAKECDWSSQTLACNDDIDCQQGCIGFCKKECKPSGRVGLALCVPIEL